MKTSNAEGKREEASNSAGNSSIHDNKILGGTISPVPSASSFGELASRYVRESNGSSVSPIINDVDPEIHHETEVYDVTGRSNESSATFERTSTTSSSDHMSYLSEFDRVVAGDDLQPVGEAILPGGITDEPLGSLSAHSDVDESLEQLEEDEWLRKQQTRRADRGGKEDLEEDDFLPLTLPWTRYLLAIFKDIFARNIRASQAKLILWEFLEHFDFINDGVFLFRVCSALVNRQSDLNQGAITSLCLCCIYVISIVTYSVRQFVVYHRIEGDNKWIFCPVIVFQQIRLVAYHSPEALWMFERLLWTYQLLMRILEDIPQFITGATFLASYGRDFYTSFTVAYSGMMMVMSSYRMGVMYPLGNTLALFLSKEPPIDSPVMSEASTTTRYFPYLLAFCSVLWSGTFLGCCWFVPSKKYLMVTLFALLSFVMSAFAVFFIVYGCYLESQFHATARGMTDEAEAEQALLMGSRRKEVEMKVARKKTVLLHETSVQGRSYPFPKETNSATNVDPTLSKLDNLDTSTPRCAKMIIQKTNREVVILPQNVLPSTI